MICPHCSKETTILFECGECKNAFCEYDIFIRPNNIMFPDAYFVYSFRRCEKCMDDLKLKYRELWRPWSKVVHWT